MSNPAFTIWLYFRRIVTIGLFVSLCGASLTSIALAQPTPTVNYQGKLMDDTGAAVVDGSYNIRFWLFQNTGQATTSAIWTEALTGSNQVSVVNGLFSVMLGSTSPLTSVDFNQPLYLGVEIGGTGTPTWDGEMLPRKPLGTVPAAFQAEEANNAQTLGGVASTSFLRSDVPDSMDAFLTLTAGAQTSDLIVTGTATTTNLVVGSDFISSLTGVGLTITGNALSVSSSSLNLTLSGLTDTNLTSPNEGDLFSFVGGEWVNVATSSLGFIDTGATDFLSLTDTPGSFNANRIMFTNSGGTALTDDANFTFDGTALTIGGMTISDVLTTHTGASTTTIPANNPYAWTISTGVGVPPLFRIDTTTGQEFVNIGNGSGDVLIGDIGSGADLVFEESSTISGQGANTITLGTTGDTFNVAASYFGIGTSSPSRPFTIATTTLLTGALLDRTNSAGTNGMVMQTTGTGVQWVATSSLGFGSGDGSVTSVDASGGTTGLTFTGGPITDSGTLTLGGTLAVTNGGTGLTSFTTGDLIYASGANTLAARSIGTTGQVLQVSGGVPTWVATSSLGFAGVTDFLSLTDTPGSFTANRLFFTNGTGDAVTDSANLTFDGTTFTAPTTTIAGLLTVTGDILPSTNLTHNLGSSSNRFANVWAETLNVGTSTWSIFGGSGNTLNFTSAAEQGGFPAASFALVDDTNPASPYDVVSSIFVDSLIVTARDNTPYDITFSDTGTRMFILGSQNNSVYTYNLGTPFDLSTASFSTSTSFTAQEADPSGLAFSTDGSKMFIVGFAGDDVNEYTLGTAFNVSTATFVDSFSVLSQENGPTDVTFSTDGSKMFIVGFTGADVNEYTLGTAFDVSTATFVDSFSISGQESTPTDVLFTPDGFQMFVVGDTSVIYIYTLGTAFDVSTASFTASESVLAQDTLPQGIAFSSDGSRLFMVGNNGNAVFEYSITDFGSIAEFAVQGNITTSDRLAVGTAALNQTLTVDGTMQLTGALFDATNLAGTDGMILQTTGTGVQWVATSSLGYGSDFLSLTDTPGSFTANRLMFTNSGGTALTDSASLVFDGTNFGIGTSSPSSKLHIYDAINPTTLTVESDGGQSVLSLDTENEDAIVQFVTGVSDTWYLGKNDSNGKFYIGNTAAGGNATIGDGDFFTIETSGNIGIGTDSPNNLLDLTDSSPIMYLSDSDNADTSDVHGGAIQWRTGTNGAYGNVGFFNNRSLRIQNLATGANSDIQLYTEDDITFDVAGSELMRLDGGSRNVGIGTSSPSSKLDVWGDFRVGTSSTPTLFVSAGGNRVGIGTSTPQSKLSLQNLTLNGAGISGIDQYLVTTNSVDAAVQFGNRTYISASNTATTTLVGSIFRVADGTTFGNTVRGLEVQTDRGANTQGENTALSGFARTFGVRGYSSGDAGGSFEPAGGFFETGGTTQGNAIRGYSSSITTASLLSLFQDTSNFTGTGLQMNFGNTTGSFSSSSSKYLDFQNAGTSVFTVSAFGTTTIGDGTTNNMAGLQIGYGGICVDNDGTCTASTTGQISSVSSYTGNSDLAEMYFSSDDLEPGQVVTLVGELSIERAVEGADLPILGVVSTKPGLTLGFDDVSTRSGEKGFPIALSGRVPVQLSTENGAIMAGDKLMLSSLPGIAMKSDGTGTTIGIALEDFNENRLYSDTFINQFGDDVAEPVFTPITTNTDPRINDGCYFGGGGAADDAPCVPLTAATQFEQLAQANELVEAESLIEAIEDLQYENSKRYTLDNGDEVRVGQIVMFVDRSQPGLNAEQRDLLTALMSTSTLAVQVDEDEPDTIMDRLVALANSFVDGIFSAIGIEVQFVKTDEVQSDTLCLGSTCIDEAELRALLAQPANTPPAPVEDQSGGGNADNPDTGLEETPAPVATTSSSTAPVEVVEDTGTSTPSVDDQIDAESPPATPTDPVTETVGEETGMTEDPVEEDTEETNESPEEINDEASNQPAE